MTTKSLICIGCPIGCDLRVEMDNDVIHSVSGNTCKRGREYAENEVLHPMRTVTSTVKVINGTSKVTSVRTRNDIPKNLIEEVMKGINGICASAPVNIGDVLLENVAGTGVDIIATKNVGICR